ncbi:MAG: anaerobic ribonucleoside-triphosphate reductase activating protein [Oscillospiraceae bacterium]|nr:anaerobic ribonucleoside-triphosphate reductase activating protein [Oscillospiraceae bacterium]
MQYAAIKTHDIANGPGVRVSLFVSGCTHACPDCFNPEAWDFAYGNAFGEAQAARILQALAPEHIRGFSLLGGEPLHPCNSGDVLQIARRVHEAYPQKDIWCYTGYDFTKELLSMAGIDPRLRTLLGLIDVLVDGRFVAAKKDLNLRFKGSENQRIIRAKESIQSGKLILWDGERSE